MSKNYNIDFNRVSRIGFPEVVFASNKDVNTLRNIIKDILIRQKKVLVTKLQHDKYETLKDEFKNSFYDEVSQIFTIGKLPKLNRTKPAVAIISGGSSDEFVVNEAHYTLSFLGISSKRFVDIGAAGIYRLLNSVDEIKQFKVLIVCAGFEGALPTVVGGLFSQPIICVPVSVGYGVAEGGNVALNSMLSSCANGLSVVNIDNGYGAAIAAFRILNINKKKK
ncbi:MAG: nickel pincer cofactor biosynthesis protein LarB [Ignavibacteria bacterium]|jgi:NCAIR mutase (PurE)-related protein